MPFSSLDRSDLILYRNRYDLPVLHRILNKRKTCERTFRFLTKGDALIAFDEEIDGSKVLGKVLMIEKPATSGEVKHIDMNSRLRRNINFLIAALAFYRTHTRFPLSAAVAKIT